MRPLIVRSPVLSLLGPLLLISQSVLAADPAANRQVDDDDTAEIRQVMTQNCLMCHSEELVKGQRLTAKQWAAEVDKMIGWGAPVPPDRKAALTAYLAATYSDKIPKPVPARITPDEALALNQADPRGTASKLPKGDATRGTALNVKHCATCHGLEAGGGDLGTNLVEKPVLLREAEFLDLTRNGRRRMPGFAALLKPQDEADLLAWLKSKRTP